MAFANLGDNLSGSVYLLAGDYSVEIYSKANASARSRTANKLGLRRYLLGCHLRSDGNRSRS
jgi:hypothetical protein